VHRGKVGGKRREKRKKGGKEIRRKSGPGFPLRLHTVHYFRRERLKKKGERVFVEFHLPFGTRKSPGGKRGKKEKDFLTGAPASALPAGEGKKKRGGGGKGRNSIAYTGVQEINISYLRGSSLHFSTRKTEKKENSFHQSDNGTNVDFSSSLKPDAFCGTYQDRKKAKRKNEGVRTISLSS